MKQLKSIISATIIATLTILLFIPVHSQGQKKRIITAGSVITEIVCELGHCNDIIATDRTSVFPSHMQQLPSIGYRNSINSEGIISLNPDLILAEKNYVKEEVIEQLKNTSIEFHALIDALSFKQTKELIRSIANILDETEKGEQLIKKIGTEIEDISAKLSNLKVKPKLLFILSHNEGTPMIAGQGTFATNLFKMAGGLPAVTDINGYKPLNTEALIIADPDYIIFSNRSFAQMGGAEGALKIKGLAETKAGKNKNIFSLDLVMISNFGPRLPLAVKELAKKIHPEL